MHYAMSTSATTADIDTRKRKTPDRALTAEMRVLVRTQVEYMLHGGDGVFAIQARDRQANEIDIQQRFERECGIEKRLRCVVGVPDIVTDTLLLEIKSWQKWKNALGQIFAYAEYFPGREHRIHLFGKPPADAQVAAIRAILTKHRIDMTVEPFQTRIPLLPTTAVADAASVSIDGVLDEFGRFWDDFQASQYAPSQQPFVVRLERVCHWLGVQEFHLKRLLVGCVDGRNYCVMKNEYQSARVSGGRPKHDVWLTGECAKYLIIHARSINSEKIRAYFALLEYVYRVSVKDFA